MVESGGRHDRGTIFFAEPLSWSHHIMYLTPRQETTDNWSAIVILLCTRTRRGVVVEPLRVSDPKSRLENLMKIDTLVQVFEWH